MLQQLRQIELIEATAASLRRQYGAEAERRCDELLKTLPQTDPRRRSRADLLRALRWV